MKQLGKKRPSLNKLFDPVLSNTNESRPSYSGSQNSPATKKRIKKKLSLELEIPDENASLESRITQMVDCVGPLSSRHIYKSTGRSGVWGDNSVGLQQSKPDNDSNSDAASSDMQLKLNQQMSADRTHFITSLTQHRR